MGWTIYMMSSLHEFEGWHCHEVMLDLQNRRPIYRTRTYSRGCPKGCVRIILSFEDIKEERVFVSDNILGKVND
jgi:hypothetical protein